MIKNFETRRISRIIQVGLKYDYKCPYKREIEGDFTTEGGNVTTEARC